MYLVCPKMYIFPDFLCIHIPYIHALTTRCRRCTIVLHYILILFTFNFYMICEDLLIFTCVHLKLIWAKELVSYTCTRVCRWSVEKRDFKYDYQIRKI